MNRSSPAAVGALVALGFVPWVALGTLGDLTFVMSWGLLNTNPWHVLVFPSYLDQTQGLSSLPWSLQVWPLSLAFYVGAVASAAGGAFVDREDVRLTVGLLMLSAVGSGLVWWGLVERGATGAIPVGVVATAVVCWWVYWPRLRGHPVDERETR